MELSKIMIALTVSRAVETKSKFLKISNGGQSFQEEQRSQMTGLGER
jgi:hypothetical protein